jgi:hypothetical protein
VLLSAVGLLIVMGLIFFLWFYDKEYGYEVIYNDGPKYCKDDYRVNVADGVSFIKTLVREYSRVVEREVHNKFKKEFQLLKQGPVGAKLVISSFGESLIYIFPNAQNQIIVDCIDFPVQSALAYGFINLNNPGEEVDLRRVELYIPLSDAINRYNPQPGRIIFEEGYAGIAFVGLGTGFITFEDAPKIFSLQGQTMVGVMSGIAFRNSSPHYVRIYGHPGYHEFNLKLRGLLIILSKNTFHWAFQKARKLGTEMAEIEIKDLITKSEFFRLSLADKKLRPKAEDIIQKKARSKKDKSYEYALWEFKKDVFDLKEEAKRIGMDSTYVDELLKEPSLKPLDGTLFFYYPNARGFMLQWSLMNLSFLIILAVLTLTKYEHIPVLVLAMRAFSVVGIKLSIISLITVANGWFFWKKPEFLTFTYWLLPSTLYFLCIVYSVMIVNSTHFRPYMDRV